MKRRSNTVDLVIGAILKLNADNGERQNVTAFVQSCYCGRVRNYDFERALVSLGKISEEEQHALIEYAMQVC